MAQKKKDETSPLPAVHNPAQQVLAAFAKKYGKESVCLMSELNIKVETLPTGDPSIDKLLNGGLPIGKVIELSGLEGTGKTSLALKCAQSAQEHFPDKIVAYIDAENSLDNAFAAEKYGVDLSRFLYIPQDATNIAERLLDMLEDLAKNPDVSLVILDSIGSLLTAQNRDKSHEEGQRDTLPGLLQRTMKKVGYARKPGLAPVLMLNQLRVDQKASGPYVDPYYSPGGMAVRHGPHLRLRLVRKGQLKEGESVVGFEVMMKVLKGRTVVPRAVAVFAVDYVHGIDSVRSAADIAVKQGVIQQRGSIYDLFGQSYKGRSALLDAIRQDRSIFNDLLDNITLDIESDEG